jgi:hypothetical protein
MTKEPPQIAHRVCRLDRIADCIVDAAPTCDCCRLESLLITLRLGIVNGPVTFA